MRKRKWRGSKPVSEEIAEIVRNFAEEEDFAIYFKKLGPVDQETGVPAIVCELWRRYNCYAPKGQKAAKKLKTIIYKAELRD